MQHRKSVTSSDKTLKLLSAKSLEEVKTLRMVDFQKAFGTELLTCSNVRLLYNTIVSLLVENYVKDKDIENMREEKKCDVAKAVIFLRYFSKMYARSRTDLSSSLTTYMCNPEDLKQRDKRHYECVVNDPRVKLEWMTPCPSFEYLHSRKKKSCIDIIYGSKRTNVYYNYLSDVAIWANKNPKTALSIFGVHLVALLFMLNYKDIRESATFKFQEMWRKIAKRLARIQRRKDLES